MALLRFVLTGERGVATDFACYQLNGGAANCTNAAHWQDVVQASVPLSGLTDDVNTVHTWRQNSAGKKIPGSELTFQFIKTKKAGEPAVD